MFFKKSKVEIVQQKGHNFLWIGDYLWMWDTPVERRCQKELYHNLLVWSRKFRPKSQIMEADRRFLHIP